MSLATANSLRKIFTIFQASEGKIRPHLVLTGPSGSGKSHVIDFLAEELDLDVIQVNAAGLTKEGTSGNSLSKALSPLAQKGSRPVICFVDEFDKLFISGNTNSDLAHETTNGVQNEFLKVLEGQATVFGDYGKYLSIPSNKVLFVFAGAFNGEENIDIDRLRELGLKTEFLGRVGLTYSMARMTLEEIREVLVKSNLLTDYLKLFKDAVKADVVEAVMARVTENYEKNSLGIRIVLNLIHQYFIEGGLTKKTAEKTTFQKSLSLY